MWYVLSLSSTFISTPLLCHTKPAPALLPARFVWIVRSNEIVMFGQFCLFSVTGEVEPQIFFSHITT